MSLEDHIFFSSDSVFSQNNIYRDSFLKKISGQQQAVHIPSKDLLVGNSMQSILHLIVQMNALKPNEDFDASHLAS